MTSEFLLVVVFGGIAAAALAIVARRPRGDGLEGAVAALGRSIEDVRVSNATALGELRGELQRTLGASEQQMVTQTGATQRTLSDLSRQLGALGEQSTRIGELAKDIGSLQDLLRAPKTRGGFGELMLERLLQDALPSSGYEIQYTYRDGSRVDAIVRYGPHVVPIDSKFPAESYTQIASARDESDRRSRRRSFLHQVRRHIDAVERYVSPQDGTVDFAFMYVPSEAIYYELTVHDASPDEPDVLAYCAEHHVIPASPNTLMAYLKVVSLGMRGLAMQERTRELQQAIAQVRREFDLFVDLHGQLGVHLDNATKKFDQTARALSRASAAIEGLVQVPPVGSEQEVLPLRVANEPE